MAHLISPDIPNFTWEEIRCSHCDTVLITDRLFEHMHLLQALRNDLGRLRITSGYRCKVKNTNVGGAARSHHLTFATDVQPLDTPLADLWDAAQAAGFTGLGRYDARGFVHLDLRPEPAVWNG